MQRVDLYKSSAFWKKKTHSSTQLMVAINQGKCAKTTTDNAVQELTDYEDDLRDDVIDYALLGICCNDSKV